MKYTPDILRAHDNMRMFAAVRDLAALAERSVDGVTDHLAEANQEIDRLRQQITEAASLIRKAGGAVQSGAPNLALFNMNEALTALGRPRAFTTADASEQTDNTETDTNETDIF